MSGKCGLTPCSAGSTALAVRLSAGLDFSHKLTGLAPVSSTSGSLHCPSFCAVTGSLSLFHVCLCVFVFIPLEFQIWDKGWGAYLTYQSWSWPLCSFSIPQSLAVTWYGWHTPPYLPWISSPATGLLFSQRIFPLWSRHFGYPLLLDIWPPNCWFSSLSLPSPLPHPHGPA